MELAKKSTFQKVCILAIFLITVFALSFNNFNACLFGSGINYIKEIISVLLIFLIEIVVIVCIKE